MAKSKPAPEKGQGNLNGFIKKAKKQDAAASSDVEMDEAEDTGLGNGKKSDEWEGYSLPPISDIPDIFGDLVGNVPEIKEVADHLLGRKLRVATMCSGTESPLLALDLIGDAVFDQYNVKLEVEHVFSCEIEPFKQAYIDRNFHPPILFRDVCELGDDEAHTAFGATKPVPGNVDLLVAGTSCVDYSNLNNEKQDIEANGESGRTFRGMLSWVTKHRPPIVILENVCSAPWDKVAGAFEDEGYSAAFSRVDTKQYYIPHTRTRVYLIAVDKQKSKLPNQWLQKVKDLKRPASSTLDAFLLPSDDPRIHESRQKLVREAGGIDERRTGRTDWARCESRHQRSRLEEELGPKRPFTGWEEGKLCKLPDFAWGDWAVCQVERVWDLLEISTLRKAKEGVDPSYKTQVWNLSQNVDRTIWSNKLGISPCLTPSMIPYITNRGGPMVGLEALSLQGLPIDKLLLTRESEDNLADLAGNAMSSTVVGACILAALVIAKDLLKPGDTVEEEDIVMNEDVEEKSKALEEHIVGMEQLHSNPLDLSSAADYHLADILDKARRSSRLCACEGRSDITTRDLVKCLDCDATSCIKCGGRPEHNPQAYSPMNRIPPLDFAKELKSVLPMGLQLTNLDQAVLDSARELSGVKISESRWKSWSGATVRAAKSDLRFYELKRQEHWSVVYRSADALLELLLHPQQPEWRLYAIADKKEPANAEIRTLLQSCVARLTCSDSLLNGKWELALPHVTTLSVAIKGEGDVVQSWEAKLGLSGAPFKDKKVFSRIEVSLNDAGDATRLDRDITGTYELFDRCGTAANALHKRVSKPTDDNLPSVYLLLDPLRTKDHGDRFVFSTSTRRYEYGETRPLIASLDPLWRQSDEEETQVECKLPCTWVTISEVELKALAGQRAMFSTPLGQLVVSASNDACASANALLVCKVPIRSAPGREWGLNEWKEVDKVNERVTFQNLAWMLERFLHVDDSLNQWRYVDLPCSENDDDHVCHRCAPTPPRLEWIRGKGVKMVAREDPVEAGEYERRLKGRPSSFVVQLRVDGGDDAATVGGNGVVRIGVNFSTLIHRAASQLPSLGRKEPMRVSWRLDTSFVPALSLVVPKFTLLSNKHDDEHKQPPGFKTPLRVEQLRSLEWMLAQESSGAAPFIEQEIAEAIMAPLGWRAEGRAERDVFVRGGVLADQVGYGKTAITLGLIDCTYKEVKTEMDKIGDVDGKIPLRATLIIVPPHLTRQWDSEVRKFTKTKYKTLILSTMGDLNKSTIEDFEDADMVIVASNIFHSNVYLDNLQLLSGCSEFPNKEGRHFNSHLSAVLSSVKSQTNRLKTEGARAVMKEIVEGQERVAVAAEAARVLTKRLKGKSYREMADKDEASKALRAKKKIPLAKHTPSGLIMEVVLQSRSRTASSDEKTSAPSSPTVRSTRRRVPSQKVRIVDSDEDSDEEEPVKPKKAKAKASTKKAVKGKKSKKASDSDDDDDYMGGDGSGSEEVSDDVQSSDDDVKSDDSDADVKPKKKAASKPAPKTKAKPQKPSKKGKKSASSEVSASSGVSSDDDAMDVDEPKPKKASGKRKAKDMSSGAESDEPQTKKVKRVDTDPWKLKSKDVQNDYKQMKAPPLEMFQFGRKVVDEYTYLEGKKEHALITHLTAGRSWVLSGTPPVHNFAAVKTIAAFLNIHLGVDDDGEGRKDEISRRYRDKTAAEKFHSFREVRSWEWHANRYQLGQRFLDRFVRQNIAEIDEIPFTQKVMEVELPAAERAIYLELEHHLRALDMTIRRTKKTESDREKRLNQSLGDSKTAEEALLKRCSHFEIDISEKAEKAGKTENAMKACDVIVAERQRQLDDCKKDLLKGIKENLAGEKKLPKAAPESTFQEWVRNSRGTEIDDKEASEMIVKLLDEADAHAPKNKPKKDEVKLSEKEKAIVWKHRELTHELRRLAKELVARVRSLRYFTVVRDLQKEEDAPTTMPCPACGRDEVPIAETAVLSSCGHVGCKDCVMERAGLEECVYASTGECRSAARILNIVNASTLGTDDVKRDGRGRHFGKKLEEAIKLIKEIVEKEERVLVFVQFQDLTKKVAEAFKYHKIEFLEIKGSSPQKSKALEAFQKGGSEHVLLLNVMDESASGANLTLANHAIFLSPLLAPSKEIYQANETQAVGRLVRYGQQKHVNIYRFLTNNTIDREIWDRRQRELKQDAT